ncbi:Ketopantoate hydroxymethyltransferase [seawater metagenome]|uniref:3-methyl-2-oxobutanoate hydroxymethyltransferase n=1 Tax=seawater metagenome TaxID=1561972 RepID=A0A5E8CKQ0_9ZZZZ
MFSLRLNSIKKGIIRCSSSWNRKSNSKMTVKKLADKKKNNDKITMLTAYDFTSAYYINNSHIDIALVGDSLGMTIQGHSDTLKVTMDNMIYHSEIVSRTCQNPLIITDLPAGSYEESKKDAVNNSFDLIKKGGVDAVKIEGGKDRKNVIESVIKAGIPVMGHIGLQPQSIKQLGSFAAQGRDYESAKNIYYDALVLQDIGCFALVVECIPSLLAQKISQNLNIPVIGIGSGSHCDGQVLVYHDLLGMLPIVPNFAKKYCNSYNIIEDSINEFREDVKENTFKCRKEIDFSSKEDKYKFLNLINEIQR